MGFREEYGGMLEEALNKAVDKHLSDEAIEKLISEQLVGLLKGQIESVRHKLKADVIDLIDGEDDIK